MSKSEVMLTSRQASELLGVHESSIKRWCNSSELVSEHTSGGHRRIAWSVLSIFAQVHNLNHALALYGDQGQAVFLAKEYLQKRQDYIKIRALVESWLNHSNIEYLPSLLLYCVETCGRSFAEVCDELIYPILSNVGELWADGKLGTADEHRISQEWNQALFLLRYQIQLREGDKDNKRKAILACSNENTHELGLQCIRIILENLGYQVIYLGARVPTAEIKRIQQSEKADLLCVSFCLMETTEMIDACYDSLLSVEPSDFTFACAFGGKILEHWKVPLDHRFSKFGCFKDAQGFEAWAKTLT